MYLAYSRNYAQSPHVTQNLCQVPMMIMILIYVQGELVKLAARDLPKGIGTC
jgi:hypothetical protein